MEFSLDLIVTLAKNISLGIEEAIMLLEIRLADTADCD